MVLEGPLYWRSHGIRSMVLCVPWYWVHGIMCSMVLEIPWYLHECEIIKEALEYEFIITVARDGFPLVVSRLDLSLRSQCF